MGNDLDSLSEDHVRQLGRIVETLEKSTFDYLQLEVGELKVTIGKGHVMPPETSAPSPPPVFPVAAPPAPSVGEREPATTAPGASPSQATASHVTGTVEINSPIMGMFYSQPEPGAPPFVDVGAIVREDSTVGLVEVMKTFNAVTAGVRGRIVEICAPNAELVEYKQVLFRVVPE